MKLEPHNYAELISLIASLIFRKSLRAFRVDALILIIFASIVAELTGKYVRSIGWANNYGVFNIYQLVVAPLWMYLFGRMLDLKGTAKKIYVLISALISGLMLFNYFFFQGREVFNNYSNILLMLATIVFSCFNLFSLAFSDDTEVSLSRQPLFWINAATLLFAMVVLVMLGLQQYILANKIQLRDKSLYRAVLPSVNVILYLIYTYAFYLCHQRTKPSLSS